MDQCPICHELLSDPAAVHPCGHTFDYSCIKTWIKETAIPTCPYCRRNVARVLRNFGTKDEQGVPVFEMRRSGHHSDTHLQGIVDQEFRPAVSTTYEHMEYLYKAVKTGDEVAVVSRSLALSVIQRRTKTVSTLHRRLRIKYYQASEVPPSISLVVRTDSNSIETLDRACKEANRAFVLVQSPDIRRVNAASLEYTAFSHHLPIGDHGIRNISLQKKIWTRPIHGKKDIYINWTTMLTEHGPARPDESSVIFDATESCSGSDSRECQTCHGANSRFTGMAQSA